MLAFAGCLASHTAAHHHLTRPPHAMQATSTLAVYASCALIPGASLAGVLLQQPTTCLLSLIPEATLLCALCILGVPLIVPKHILGHACIQLALAIHLHRQRSRLCFNQGHPVLPLSDLAVMVVAVLNHSLTNTQVQEKQRSALLNFVW